MTLIFVLNSYNFTILDVNQNNFEKLPKRTASDMAVNPLKGVALTNCLNLQIRRWR